VLARRDHVDVGDDVDGVARWASLKRARRDGSVHTLVDRRAAQRVDLFPGRRGVRRRAVRLERLLVAPDFQDHELVWLADPARQLAPDSGVLLARGLATA